MQRSVPARWVRWLALGALALAGWHAGAQTPPPPKPKDAAGWIARLNWAASQSSYSGTMVFTTGSGVVSSSRVAHVCVGDQIYERVEALDGQQHRIYRHNDTVHSVWPHKQVVVVEQKSAASGLVSTRRRVEPRALAHYKLEVEDGRSVVAGRSAQVLMLTPRDELRFAQRLLADEATGLLLRADVIDASGRVLESSAFSDVSVGQGGDAKAVLDGMSPKGYEVLQSVRRPVDWAAQGWSLKARPPGFELIGSVERPALGGGGRPAVQAMFSDGLSFVSLFIEPWHEQAHRQALAAEVGATHTVMQRVGDHWITAMGDVPRHTLELFVSALESRR